MTATPTPIRRVNIGATSCHWSFSGSYLHKRKTHLFVFLSFKSMIHYHFTILWYLEKLNSGTTANLCHIQPTGGPWKKDRLPLWHLLSPAISFHLPGRDCDTSCTTESSPSMQASNQQVSAGNLASTELSSSLSHPNAIMTNWGCWDC